MLLVVTVQVPFKTQICCYHITQEVVVREEIPCFIPDKHNQLALVDELGGKAEKSGREGHEKEAYHILQHTMLSFKDLFSASESFPAWKQVYQEVDKEVL